MKMKFILLPSLMLIALIFFNFTFPNPDSSSQALEKHDLGITDDIQKIITTSCVDCHNANARGEKAKAKLQFESLDTLSLAKLIGKLAEISEEVDENKMPPEKYLEFKPEAKLSPEQKQALIKWADMTSNSLLNK